MVLNTTITLFENFFNVTPGAINIPEISSTCWNWCKEQHFNNASNLTIEGISIVVFALIILFIYTVLIKYWDYIEFERNKEKIKKIVDLMPYLTLYLLIGFLIWFIHFSGG